MYIPVIYKNTNREEVKRFVQENSFGTLIKMNTQKVKDVEEQNGKWIETDTINPILTRPLPMEVDFDSNHYKDQKNFSSLTGHIGTHYPLWKSIKKGDEVMVVFQGPHTYMSPSWYDNLEAATFNYITVNVYGTIEKLDEPLEKNQDTNTLPSEKKELIKLLKHQLYKYESHFRTGQKMSMTQLEERFKYLGRYIGAFRIKIDRFEAAFKLSQDQTDWSINNSIEQLKASGYPNSIAIAKEMEKRKPLIRQGRG